MPPVSLGSTGSALAALLIVGSGGAAMLTLLRYARAPKGAARGINARSSRWAFSPPELGGRASAQLLLASIAGLFLELLLIRWISSEIRVFAYFKNLVLIACYLGFGFGCYLARRPIDLRALVLPLLGLAILVKLPLAELGDLLARLPVAIGAISGVDIWGWPTLRLAWSSVPIIVAAVGAIVPLFALAALAFVPVGQLIGWHLEQAKQGIRAYSVNVAGSLVGILLYTLLCFFDQPPSVWFAVGGALLVLLFVRRAHLRLGAGAALAACALLVTLGPGGGSRVFWSPYQKLTLTPLREGRELIAYSLQTNGSWYQKIVNLSPAFVAGHAKLFPGGTAVWNPYNVPYRYYPDPPSVLILGSGMGNDVAAALRNGAGRVVAVEIDPLILELGRRLHFERPYGSDRVRVIVNDARSYVQTSRDRFDLVVFSLLDSHTTSSSFTNIRIDNYVYTEEALRAARSLLKRDGLFIVKFQVNQPWIAGRLHRLLRDVFGQEPVQFDVASNGTTATGGRFFVVGSPERLARAAADLTDAPATTVRRGIVMEAATPTTDDWPYFYQHEPGIPASVLIISAVLILLGWMLLRTTVAVGAPFHGHFFGLGAGFLLLEAQIVSRMALLFGTTWLVNSIVIAGLLGLILAANALVAAHPGIPTWVAYAGLLVTIALGWLVPSERLLVDSLAAKILLATVVLSAPVFFAGIAFIQSFAEAGFQSDALGSNLIGALVGGLLESLSLWTGIRSLLLFAAFLYAAACLTRARRAAEPAAGEVRLAS